MSFVMTPAGAWPTPEEESFPNFIQFQEDGVDLGGPDADTVNFIFSADPSEVGVTRGEGESANVVTVCMYRPGSGV